MCYLLSEHTANHLGFEHPVLWKLGELGYLTKSHSHEFWGALFPPKILVSNQVSPGCSMHWWDGCCSQGLAWNGFSFLVAVVSTHGFVLQKSVLIQGSHQAPNPEKTTPNPTLFGVCSPLETGKSVLGLLRHA